MGNALGGVNDGRKGFTLRLGSDLYTLGMPNTLASRITNGDEERLNAPIDVLELSIVEDGFIFVTANDENAPGHEIKYVPHCFGDFKKHLQTISLEAWPAVLKLETAGAAAILRLFYQWMNDKFAELAMAQIEGGEPALRMLGRPAKKYLKCPLFNVLLLKNTRLTICQNEAKAKEESTSKP